MKSQSAMEYLMTYGWAILIIAVVLAVLFQLGVFSGGNFLPHAQAGSCQVSRTIAGTSLEGQCNGMLPEYVAQFNGASSYILDSQAINLPLHGAPVTLTVWVYGYVFNDGTWLNGDAFGYGTPTAGNFISLVMLTGGTNLHLDNCGSASTAGGTVTTYAWHQIAMTYTGSIETLYVDGTGYQVTPPPMGSGTSSTVLIGGRLCTGPSTYWDGQLANVQIYNTSLSQSEIQALYLEGIGGAPVRPQNVVGWWPLNGNANDYSGNNNNGQLNSVTFSSSWESGYTAP